MTSGYVRWYARPWSAPRAIGWAAAAGLSVVNPVTRRVTAVDAVGDFVPTTPEALTAALSLDGSDRCSFQYWLDGGTDVYCRVRRVSGEVVVQEFALDGLEAGERDQVVRGLVSAFRTAQGVTEALVVDRSGVAEDVRWDDVVAGATPSVLPDLLVTRADGELVVRDSAGLLA